MAIMSEEQQMCFRFCISPVTADTSYYTEVVAILSEEQQMCFHFHISPVTARKSVNSLAVNCCLTPNTLDNHNEQTGILESPQFCLLCWLQLLH